MSNLFGLVRPEPGDDLSAVYERVAPRLRTTAEAVNDAKWSEHALMATAVPDERAASPGPFVSADGRWWMVFDGEVFNPDSLRARYPDASTQPGGGAEHERAVLDCFAQAGPACVEHIQGNFAMAVYDTRDRRLWLATDRLGERPLFYARYDGQFVFSNQVHALLADPRLPRGLDLTAVSELLTYEYPMDERTLLESVRVMPPGSVMEIDAAGVRVRQYWDLHYAEPTEPADLDALVDELADRLHESVTVMADADQPVGMLLSGGLDSRVVAGFLDRHAANTHSFTFGPPRCQDRRFAARVARRVGTQHHATELDPGYLLERAAEGVRVTGGMANCIHFHVLGVVDELARHAPVLVNGVGGDVLSGSYLSVAIMDAETIDDVAYRLFHHKYVSACPLNKQAALFGPELQAAAGARLYDGFVERLRRIEQPTVADACDYLNVMQRQRRFIFNGNVNLRTRLQTRSPFLMPAVLDMMARVPASLRFRQRVYTEMVCRHMPALARVPREGRGRPLLMGRLRAAWQWRWEIACDRLKGLRPRFKTRYANYANYGHWLRGPLRPLVDDLLVSGPGRLYDLVERKRVRALVDQHMNGVDDHGIVLGCLITLELWLRECLNAPTSARTATRPASR